jgi:hypothetical protein
MKLAVGVVPTYEEYITYENIWPTIQLQYYNNIKEIATSIVNT